MFNKDLTPFMQSLSRILQSDRASERKALLAGWRDVCDVIKVVTLSLLNLPVVCSHNCRVVILCSACMSYNYTMQPV